MKFGTISQMATDGRGEESTCKYLRISGAAT